MTQSIGGGGGGGGLTEVASGTTTANNETVYEYLDIPLDAHYQLSFYPTTNTDDVHSGPDASDNCVFLAYLDAGYYADLDSDTWAVAVESELTSDLTVEWRVYEI